eukprot:1826842-Alexandrium_andersonii.AAC.1
MLHVSTVSATGRRPAQQVTPSSATYGYRKCKMASGVRNLNCAVPEKTSELAPNSTLQGLVRGVRRHFAR